MTYNDLYTYESFGEYAYFYINDHMNVAIGINLT